ncbi:MAG: helix-turn-helix domain-containing protein [Clostridia bacterium]|nr:helix-turn-helix domain-containing protein [Clostridia bacterium]
MAQENIEKKVELAWLMAFYQGVLTEKQREALSMHCEEDMSLSEIAEETGVSRQSVHNMLQHAADKLFSLESTLHMAKRFRFQQEGLETCLKLLEDPTSDHVQEARKTLETLIRWDQEDQEEHHGL